MNGGVLVLVGNRFETRKDYQNALLELIKPLQEQFINSEEDLISLGSSGAIYEENRAAVETLLRPLWGLAPYWLFQKDNIGLQTAYLKKIRVGTDPKHQLYWGNIENYDQYIVEIAALSLTILLHAEKGFLSELEQVEKDNLANWLNQALTKTIPKNNWTFFKILIRLALVQLGRPLNQDAMTAEFDLIETMYIGNGWYCDGKAEQRDYYIAFAFHYYSLIYVKFMREKDPVRCQTFIERAKLFAKEYTQFFDDSGEALPYGRSLTYRFAQGAFFSALIFANVEAIPWGEMKNILSNHLTSWMEKPIFTFDGRLSIGYHYENLVMAEGYNSPGSPYWSLKVFLLLATPVEHPFWKAERVVNKKKPRFISAQGRMLLCHVNHQVMGYPAGLTVNNQAHADAKYNKFVYSSKFGFSVPKANVLYEEGAFDNTLAISLDNRYYRCKGEDSDFDLNEKAIHHEWQPFLGVQIKTTIYPLGEWHIRVHEIENDQTIVVKEGGFSVPLEGRNPEGCELAKEASVYSKQLQSRIIAIEGFEKGEIIRPEVNTSVFFNRSCFPALTTKLKPGKHQLISLVGGLVKGTKA
jgi:hypothetical protein